MRLNPIASRDFWISAPLNSALDCRVIAVHNTGILMHVKARRKMPSQCNAFRLTVAEQMAGYEQRIAKKIKAEAEKRGESPTDLAAGIGAHVSTTERWFRAERVPQRRHKKELREYWDLPVDFFEIDLDAEEKELRDQLNRIERMLVRVVAAQEDRTAEEIEAEFGIDADQELSPSGTADD